MWPHLLVKVGQNKAKYNICTKDAVATGKHLDLGETLFLNHHKKKRQKDILCCNANAFLLSIKLILKHLLALKSIFL